MQEIHIENQKKTSTEALEKGFLKTTRYIKSQKHKNDILILTTLEDIPLLLCWRHVNRTKEIHIYIYIYKRHLLWTFNLCNLQDSSNQKHRQGGKMDKGFRLYNARSVTFME